MKTSGHRDNHIIRESCKTWSKASSPIATQTTTLSDSVARVKTPFGGGPADMSEVAAKTYGNKFITKV